MTANDDEYNLIFGVLREKIYIHFRNKFLILEIVILDSNRRSGNELIKRRKSVNVKVEYPSFLAATMVLLIIVVVQYSQLR